MDYSLLVGVHEVDVGNSKHVRNQLVICVSDDLYTQVNIVNVCLNRLVQRQ